MIANVIASSLSQYFAEDGIPFLLGPMGETWGCLLAALIHGALLLAVFAHASLVFIWLERKVSGRIQDRLGPTRVGGRFGWLQGLADGGKLVQKEDLVPKDADSMLFRIAPYIACVAAFCAFMVLPFYDGWATVASDIGLFILFAILSLEVLGIILAGYSSGSKWSLFGGMREAAQMVSYEIPLSICGLVPIVSLGTLDLAEIGALQGGGYFWNWIVFSNPFCFIAFFVYFTVATAGCKRAPFDLAEAESELVGGFHTEYSGMRWSYFFMAEYGAMFLVSLLAAILFLGAWFTGLDFIDAPLQDLRFKGLVSGEFSISGYLVGLFGMAVLMSKGFLLVFVQIWLRWTLPRLRIDQVMTTCLKYLIPISCFLFLGATIWPLALAALLGRTTIIAAAEPLGVRTARREIVLSKAAELDQKPVAVTTQEKTDPEEKHDTVKKNKHEKPKQGADH